MQRDYVPCKIISSPRFSSSLTFSLSLSPFRCLRYDLYVANLHKKFCDPVFNRCYMRVQYVAIRFYLDDYCCHLFFSIQAGKMKCDLEFGDGCNLLYSVRA